MTTYLNELADGVHGYRFAVPPEFESIEELPRGAAWADRARGVVWQLTHVPTVLDLDPSHEGLLRDDIEQQARALFEDTFAELAADNPNPHRKCRTKSDPAWSPVVHVERAEVDAAPALAVIARGAYEGGTEGVGGHVLVPIARGTVVVTITAVSHATGQRETLLRESLGAEGDPAREPTQAQFDAPEHDAAFPGHPLTLVRAALRWLLDARPSLLTVSERAAEPARGELALPECGCSVVAPPRYVVVPPGVFPSSPTLTHLTRMAIGREPVRLLEVWSVAGERLVGSSRTGALKDLALEKLRDWDHQGAAHVHATAQRLRDDGGRALVSTEVEFRVNDRPRHGVARWIAEPDGRVFNISAAAPTTVPREALRADVEAVYATFRPAPERAPEAAPEPAGAPAEKKPWWRFW